jgi:hypothetical protein
MRRKPRRLYAVATAAVLPLLLATSSPALASGSRPVRAFEHSLRIDNRLFPLRPGTQFVFDGTVTDAEGRHAHRIVFTVTDMVKRVDGVWSRVIWDQDINDGELTEAELAFFAQDRRKNVFTMGEYPEEYEGGTFVGAPSTWISGQAKATAGILVPGHPRVGLRFVQGRAPAVGFFDVGVVKRAHAKACAPVGCFTNTTLIEESAPLAPEDGQQLKYYAPGVGLVRIDAVGGDAQEVMTLTKVRHLGAAGIARARASALKLEHRAYRVNASYRHTPPMRRCVGRECRGR